MFRHVVVGQKGEGKLGVIIWLAIIGAGVFAASRIVPVKFNVMSFHEFADSTVQTAGATSNPDPAKIIESITAKAKELNLPLDRKQMVIGISEREIRLDMRHAVDVDLAVTKWNWAYDEHYVHSRF